MRNESRRPAIEGLSLRTWSRQARLAILLTANAVYMVAFFLLHRQIGATATAIRVVAAG